MIYRFWFNPHNIARKIFWFNNLESRGEIFWNYKSIDWFKSRKEKLRVATSRKCLNQEQLLHITKGAYKGKPLCVLTAADLVIEPHQKWSIFCTTTRIVFILIISDKLFYVYKIYRLISISVYEFDFRFINLSYCSLSHDSE